LTTPAPSAKSTAAGITTFVALNFNNYGTLDIQAGTFIFSGSFVNYARVTLAPGTTNRMANGGSATGSFNAPATALVEWTGNGFTSPYTLNAGAQLNGAVSIAWMAESSNFNADLPFQNLDLVAHHQRQPDAQRHRPD